MLTTARGIRLLCIVSLATTSIALAEAQTTKTTPPAKKATASAEKNPLPFANARDMAVMIFWADPTPGGRPHAKAEPSGSGVWIGKSGYVATCNHVIANWAGPFKIGIARDPYVTENSPGASSVSITGMVNTFVAVLVASDPAADVAVLKVENTPEEVQKLIANSAPLVAGAPMGTLITKQHPISPRGASLKTDFPEQGETMLLAGFPLSHNTLVVQTGIATGFLSNATTPQSRPSSALRIMLSLVSNPGNSGGPVFDAEGRVIGLLEGNLTSPIRDEQSRQVYSPRVKLDASGQPIRDAAGQVQFDIIPLQENSGISLAVPAKFIADLAKNKNIDLQ